MSWYCWDGADLMLSIRVQPRARRDGFSEVVGDAMKVQLRAPPVDDKANAALIALLADIFGVPQRAVIILSGHHARVKRVRVVAPRQLPAVLVSLLRVECQSIR